MHEMQAIVIDDRGVCLSVCLSRGLTRLLCEKTAELIKMLFGVNTLGGPRNIVLYMGPDSPHREGEGELGKILPTVDPLHISGMAEARDLKLCAYIEGSEP